MSLEEIDANACLIAAAPDLLDSCKMVMVDIHNQRTAWGDTKFLQMMEKRLVDVIAKAEGRSP